jgi:P4 family phage/plasmid primase-like protien
MKMSDQDQHNDHPDESSSDIPDAEEESVVEEIQEIIDQNDGDPMVILDHREWPYTLAEWYASNEFEEKKKYLKVVDYINWRSVEMRRDDFEDQIESAAAEIQDSEESQPIHEMSPSEFFDHFTWPDMPDRQIAYFCHLWCKENAPIVFSNDQVFVYDGDIWVNEPKRVARILQRLLRAHYGKHVKEEFLDGYVSVNDAYHVDWDEMGVSGSRCVVENGILNLGEGEIERETKPSDYALIRFPVRWEGIDAKCDRWLNEFLDRSVNDADLQKLQEYTGYCLHTHDYPYKKALMMLGDGNNGKGVFEDVITAAIGLDNVMNYGLRDLSGANFGLQRLQNTAVNINSDIEGNEITHTSAFKKLTGRDRFKVEPKYETPFEIENAAKLMFAANQIPDVDTQDLAFYSRWVFVEFPHRFTTRDDDGHFDADPHIADDIIENELPGVLAWMVEGYQQLRNQAHFTDEMAPEEVRTEWKHLSDPTITFIRNFLKSGHPAEEGDPQLKGRMTVSELYEHYEKYMATTPVSAVTKQTLAQYIKNRFEADTTTERRGPDKEDVKRVWDGVFIAHENRNEIRDLYQESL